MRNFSQKSGFTLIELLVVISIIGMLASMVLVSLYGARNRARDARIIADMGQLRSAAELYFVNNNNSYSNFCDSSDENTLEKDIKAQQGRNYNCFKDTADYCIEVQLNNDKWWCIDSKLRSQQYSSNPACASGVYSCE